MAPVSTTKRPGKCACKKTGGFKHGIGTVGHHKLCLLIRFDDLNDVSPIRICHLQTVFLTRRHYLVFEGWLEPLQKPNCGRSTKLKRPALWWSQEIQVATDYSDASNQSQLAKMKIFISADIEGVSGITTRDEARKTNAVYREFQTQMNREVAAACEGALAAGASEILIKDAHGGGDNLIAADLPEPAKLIRSWSGHPFSMVQELDESFDAALFIGYHARAGAGGNPLAHTMSSKKVHRIFINDRETSEFYIHYLAAGLVKVPVVMLSGDKTICEEVRGTDPAIETANVKDANGSSTINMHPNLAVELIRTTAERAVRTQAALPAKLPDSFELKVVFKEQSDAFYSAQYPGANLYDPYTVTFRSEDYFDILRAVMFLI